MARRARGGYRTVMFQSPPLPLPRARRLGPFEVPRLALGTMRMAGAPVDALRGAVAAALDAGLSVVDTAPIYGAGGPGFGDAEARLGAAMAADRTRDRLVLVTKAGIEPGAPYDSSAATLRASCEASLRRLRTDRIDLFLVHRPDDLAGAAEVAGALDGLVADGLARAVGVSNHTASRVRALAAHLAAPVAANQVEMSPLALGPLQDGVLDQCDETGIAPMAWSPLAGGALLSPEGPRAAAVAAALDRIAEANGIGRDVAALAWVLAHPSGVVPVLGTGRPERVAAAARAFEARLDRRGWYDVLEAARGAPMP